jgi:hypothetical protein
MYLRDPINPHVGNNMEKTNLLGKFHINKTAKIIKNVSNMTKIESATQFLRDSDRVTTIEKDRQVVDQDIQFDEADTGRDSAWAGSGHSFWLSSGRSGRSCGVGK